MEIIILETTSCLRALIPAKPMAVRGLVGPMEPSGGRPSRPAPAVRLVPMTEAERDEALRDEAADYAKAKTRAGFWSREESLGRARAEIASLVGSDPAKRGHEFFVGVDDAGRRVGWAWYGPVPGSKPSKTTRWLFQIVVDEALRGNGFGRGLLQALEQRLRDEGADELRLNVFRWNSVAIALYRSAGYEAASEGERNLEMRKSLARW